MTLTDTACRNAKPKDKAYKLFDERGLYLLVNPNGAKGWRFKYQFSGKEKLLSLGVYPDVSLGGRDGARARRDAGRELLARGVDPSAKRQAEKQRNLAAAGNSFQVIAREWFAKFSPGWKPTHAEKIIRRLERDVFPWIGTRPITEITAPELLTVLRRLEARGVLETAHRAHQNCGQVFRYAVATGRAERDPSGDLRGALAPWKPQHFASITEPKAIGDSIERVALQFSGSAGFFR
jgi:hypothetical protein